jgi:hypothetical protein
VIPKKKWWQFWRKEQRIELAEGRDFYIDGSTLVLTKPVEGNYTFEYEYKCK